MPPGPGTVSDEAIAIWESGNATSVTSANRVTTSTVGLQGGGARKFSNCPKKVKQTKVPKKVEEKAEKLSVTAA